MHPAPGRADRHGHRAQVATVAGGAWKPAAHHHVAAESATPRARTIASGHATRTRSRRQAGAGPPDGYRLAAFRKDLFKTLFPHKPPLLNSLHAATYVLHKFISIFLILGKILCRTKHAQFCSYLRFTIRSPTCMLSCKIVVLSSYFRSLVYALYNVFYLYI